MSLSFVLVWSALLSVLWGLSYASKRSGHRDISLVWSSFAWLILGVGLSRVFLWEPMRVEGNSMAPTLTSDQTVVVNKHAFGFQVQPFPWRVGSKTPELGDVIVFRSPEGDYWIKRVVAGPGDHIAYIPGMGWFKDGVLVSPAAARIADFTRPSWMSYFNTTPLRGAEYEGWEITMPPNRYFVLGDNRTQSLDSRKIGPVHVSRMSGRVDQ